MLPWMKAVMVNFDFIPTLDKLAFSQADCC